MDGKITPVQYNVQVKGFTAANCVAMNLISCRVHGLDRLYGEWIKWIARYAPY